jgi:hypothetical protein
MQRVPHGHWLDGQSGHAASLVMNVARTESIVMKKLLAIAALGTAVALTASPAFAAASHNGAPERPAVERSNRSNLYQSDSQGNQPYPNPDRELYVPELPG